MSYQVQDACGHTTVGHMFYHVLCPNQSLETRVTQVVLGGLLLIGGIFAIYSFIANRSSTPASPKTPEVSKKDVTEPSSPMIPEISKQATTEPVSPKKVVQATQSIIRATIRAPESCKHDHNDAVHLDKSMAGKKISDIQDIETILRLFPKPTYEETQTNAYRHKERAFSFVSNEVLSTFLENPIDDKVYLIDYFSTDQIRAIDIEKIPLSNLENMFMDDPLSIGPFSRFRMDRYFEFNMDQHQIIESRLHTHLKRFTCFKRLQSSTPDSPKTPEINKKAIPETSSPKIPEINNPSITEPSSQITQTTGSKTQSTILHAIIGTPESWKHDHNDAGHLDESMAGKKISDIQDIKTILRLFPHPSYETSEWQNKKIAFSFVSNEVLSALLENSIDDKDYLVEYFSTEQFCAIDIEKVPLSNLKKIFFDALPTGEFYDFSRNFYVQFNTDQRKIIDTRLQSILKDFPGFEHLK